MNVKPEIRPEIVSGEGVIKGRSPREKRNATTRPTLATHETTPGS